MISRHRSFRGTLSLARTLAALFVALVMAQCHRVDARTLTLSQYDQALGVVQKATETYALHSSTGPSRSVAPGTVPIEAALAPIVRCVVLMPKSNNTPGTLIFIDNRPTLATLRRIDRESDSARRNKFLAGLRDQLTLLRAQAQAASSSASQGQRGAQAVRSVLDDHEFSSDPIPAPSSLERAMDKSASWFDEQWRKFLRLFHAPTPPPDMKIDPRVPLGILIAIAVIVGGFLLAFLARLVTGANWARFRQAQADLAETGLALTAEEATLVAARDFDQLLALARQRADEGDYRSAFRLVYLATLVTLDRQGLVRLNKSRTNWEYLRAVRLTGNEAVYAALLPMTRGFDRIWYGLRPATRTDYEQALTEHASLRAQAGVT